ncbi:hypothetical protein CgunFtcFv8_025027 [Champsocephalus gunnari]|uniref:Uncharacterized protein n=1 Tax=Champsocephalus gunnari TaxID=52237 RepID=A0AAN8DD59_CHAGU|nr:hypothetical protein CgunFtcFv8_025027 [Champsocephalus gunnari]
MQDRQTQVRGGPARAAGRLRDTDGMLTAGEMLLLLHTGGLPEVQSSQEKVRLLSHDFPARKPSRLPHSSSLSSWTSPLNVILPASPLRLLCLSSPLSVKVSQSYFGGGGGVGLPPQLHGSKGEGVCRLLSISLAPPLPHSLSSHVSLPLYPSKSPHF